MLTYDDNFCEAFQKETLPGLEKQQLRFSKTVRIKIQGITSTADQNSGHVMKILPTVMM